MISQKQIQEVLKNYDPRGLTIGVLGGHSALDVCAGVRKFGFKTVVVAQKGREAVYTKYYKMRKFGGKMRDGGCCGGGCGDEDGGGDGGACGGGGCGNDRGGGERGGVSGAFDVGCVDDVIVVDSFKDVTSEGVQERLRAMHTIFIHNRYFWVYCDYDAVERDFLVPIYGNRGAVKLEERDQPKNQYHLLAKAGIRMPKIFKKPADIDRLCIVKVNEATRGYERAFFLASSAAEFTRRGDEMIAAKRITRAALETAVIEEYIVGAQVNLNFFYSPLSKTLELLGTDMRRQTNLDGVLRLTADEQHELFASGFSPKMIETGHVAVTMKESLLGKAYEIGEKFVAVMHDEAPPGMIGPFALQGAVVADEGKEEFVIFDVSMRIPGSPGTKFTPYSGYLYGNPVSYGERIGLELACAVKMGRLGELVS